MGINPSAVKVFLMEAVRQELSGRLLTLGKQDAFVTPEILETIFSEFGRHVRVPEHVSMISPKPSLASANYITGDYLYSALGFDEWRSLDASEYEKADYIFDLNQGETPDELCETADVIFDGGTIEHVFHIPNVFANIYRMLKMGGRIIHIAPSSNHIDHGMYMFSPTLFWDYYHANNYDVKVCEVFYYSHDGMYHGEWVVSDYVPGALARVSMGGLDDSMYGVIVIASKKAESTYDVIPQQGLYSNIKWSGQEPDAEMLGHDPKFRGKGLGLKVKRVM
jgi:SAM-dependent methyltransferase